MSNPSSLNTNQVDLTTCDKEPIHLLGKIQRIGYLLAVRISDFSITFYSQNAPELFGVEITRTTKLQNLVPSTFVKKVTEFKNSLLTNQPCDELLQLNNTFYQIYCSSTDTDSVILEFEAIPNISQHLESGNSGLLFVSKSLEYFNRATNELDLVTNAVELFKQYTQFDRVMVYKFDENRNGHVIAESKAFGLDSFLGLNYPASDIPKQAYQLYLTNKVRAIHSVFDEGVNIISNQANSYNTIDLSYSIFRSVSPIHIQYLKNMGVTATHAVSLIQGDKLWGMLICHNYSGEKHLNINQRINTQLFGDLLMNKINILGSEKRLGIDSSFNTIIQKIAISHKPIQEILSNLHPDLQAIFEYDSLLYFSTNQTFQLGKDIPFNFKETLLEKLHQFENQKNAVYTTTSICKDLFDTEQQLPYQGLLKIDLSGNPLNFILLLKEEQLKTINWAGNPNKALSVNPNDHNQLSPRQSFAQFTELIKYQSLPISQKQIELAFLLRDALISSQIDYLRINDKPEESQRFNDLLSRRTQDLMKLNTELSLEIKQNRVSQQNLELAKTASEQLTKIKSEFLANLSHEMRTPLNGIMGISHLLKDEVNSEHQSYIDLQIESIERLIKSVNRILEMAKVDQAIYDHHFEQVNLKELFDEILSPLEILAKSKQQQFIVAIHQPNETFVTDSFLIHQIISNLTSNAIKYTPNHGTIQVHVKVLYQDLKYLDVTVEDTGIGISKENIQKIFESYFTESKGTRKKDDSFGLGLYLVKNYLNNLNGTITVTSEEKKGSQFHVKIPITQTNPSLL